MTCVKPFTIPDRWIEKQTPPWDPERHRSTRSTTKATRSRNPDVYIGPQDKADLHRLQRRARQGHGRSC